MEKHRTVLTFAAALACSLSTGTVSAQTPPAAPADDKHLAAALFDTGTQKMKAGNCEKAPVGDRALCEEAVDAFHRSHRAYAGALGSLKNAALIEKNMGKTASAVRDLRVLALGAADDPRPERKLWATLAREEIAALLPRVPKLRISVQLPAPPGLEVRVDNAPLNAAAWNTFIEIDPGRHTITLTAAQRLIVTREVDLAAGDEGRVDLSYPQPERPVAATVRSTDRGDADLAPARSNLGPAIVVGTGAVATVVGLVFGGLAIKTHGDVCNERNECERDGLDRGRAYATTANVLVGVGLVTVAAGALWYFLGRRSTPATGTNMAKNRDGFAESRFFQF